MVTALLPLTGPSTQRQDFASGDSIPEIVDLEAAPRLDEPELTLRWVEDRRNWGHSHFRKFYAECRTADEFLLNNFDFHTVDGATKIKLGTAHSVIKTLVAHVTPEFMDISVPPPGRRAQARAEKLERFLTGSNQMIERETPVDRHIAQHQGLYGVAFERIAFEAEKWPEFPEFPEEGEADEEYKDAVSEVIDRRAIVWPITSEAVNPQEIIWDDFNGSKPRWLIWEQGKVDAPWVAAHFGTGVGGDYQGSSAGEVDFVQVWTHSQYAFIADGQWALRPRRHGYMRLPWVMYDPQMGLITLENKPEDRYRGILHSNFEMLRAQSKLASHYIDIVERAAWTTEEFSGPPGITETAMQRWSNRPGAKNYLPPNVTRRASDSPRVPQEIMLAKGILDESIEENTAPAVARGQRPTGAASGYQTAVLAGIASLNFGAVKVATERGREERNELILMTVEHVIADRVTVFGKTEAGTLDESVGPNDIRGHYVNIVRLNSVSPEEQDRKRNQAFNEWRGGFIDHVTALRNAGQTSPLEVLGNLAAEKLLNSDLVQQALAQVAAQRVPTLEQILQAASGGAGSAQEITNLATQILGANGEGAPNAGQFQLGNQAGIRPQAAGTGTPTTVRPVIPGSTQEAQNLARQLSGPRTGIVRTTGGNLRPGGSLG